MLYNNKQKINTTKIQMNNTLKHKKFLIVLTTQQY